MHPAAILIGIVITVLGVALLRAAWMARRAGDLSRRRVLVITAWLLLAASLLPWSIGAGADKGTAFAFIVMMLTGAVVVIREGFRHAPRNGNGRLEREAREQGMDSDGFVRFLRRAWVFMLAGPLSLVLSLLIAFILFAAWDMTDSRAAANRLAAALISVPLAWALLATWMTYDIRLRTRSVHALVLFAAGLGGVWITGGLA